MRFYILSVLFLLSQASFAQSFEDVVEAFSPIEGSPYSHMVNLEVISNSCIKKVWEEISHRYTLGDLQVAKVARENMELYEGSLFLLDSGGPHSILAAVELAENGFQPIMNMGSDRNSFALQTIGVMKYTAQRMAAAKKKLDKNAPPVFILDVHRNSDLIANSLPSLTEVVNQFNGQVVWLTERGPEWSAFPKQYSINNSNEEYQFSPINKPIYRAFEDGDYVNLDQFNSLDTYMADQNILVREHGVSPYYYGEKSVYMLNPRPNNTDAVNIRSNLRRVCPGWSNEPY